MAGKHKGKKGGGRSKGRAGKGRAGTGRGNGNGAGGRGGRGQQMVRPQGPPQCRLFHLGKSHLVLKCFDYLDDASRQNVFKVMGWPLDNYLRRKEMMRKQRQHMKEMEAKKLKEEEQKREPNEEDAKIGVYDRAHTTAKDLDKLTSDEEELHKPTEEVQSLLKNVNKLAVSVNEAWEEDGGGQALTPVPSVDNIGEEEENKKEEDEGEVADLCNMPNEEGEDDEKAKKEAAQAKEIKEAKEDEAGEILPPLFARVDPHTLLDRLNTRRLYLRVLHFKRTERNKLQEEKARVEAIAIGNDDEAAKVAAIVNQMGIKESFDKELKERQTLARVYRKNITIAEMSDLEWDELCEVAQLKHDKEDIPFDPIPPQHELLQFQECPRAVAVLASYPRSGNSLMRTMYEGTTLRVTGSDMQGGLAKHDLVGEMAVGANMVQFVKTHYPERMGSMPFRASRAVLLVRNPFDCIESFFNLMMTGSHTSSIDPEVRKKTTTIWENYVLREIRVWKRFHKFWMEQDIPVLHIRYEDLIRYPDKVCSRMIQFVLEVTYMNTFFTERIDRCITEQQKIEKMGSYKPRSGGIGKSYSKYSDRLRNIFHKDAELRGIMKWLGYEDMLVKPASEWSEIPPLKNYASEYLPSWHKTGNAKVCVLNRPNIGIARTKDDVTPWQRHKIELGIAEGNCNCDKCQAIRKQAKISLEDSPNEVAGQGDSLANLAASINEAW